MAWRVIKVHRGSGCSVVVHARDEEGCCKQDFTFRHKPYFYCLESENIQDSAIVESKLGFKSVFGDKLKKVYLKNPSDTPRVRELFSKTWEADIPYARRFLVDKHITSGFDFVNSESEDIIPVELPFVPLKVGWIDIEVRPPSPDKMPSFENDPVTCICIASEGFYYSAIYDPEIDFTGNKDNNWSVAHLPTEEKLLWWLAEKLEEENYDIISGWNVDFDLEYLQKRCEVLKIPLNVSGSCELDLLQGYRSLYRRKSYRLKDITVDEGIVSEAEPVVDYAKMWEEDKQGLVQRNKNHTEWCYLIDKKRRIVEYWWHLKEIAGLESLKDIHYNSVLIDTMLLRRAEGALPSKEEHHRESFEGAYVMEPPKGVVKGVAVFDFSSMYPRTILAENLCPVLLHRYRETHPGPIDWITYKDFAKGKIGLLPGLVGEMLEERVRLEKGGHKEKVAAIKGLVNSIYGVQANPGNRLYEPEIAKRITEAGRDLVKGLIERLKGWGHKVIASDTDSVFVVIPEDSTHELLEKINSSLPEGYFLKLEHYATAMLFTGKKKRYAYSENGSIHFTGFEFKRSDSSNLTRGLQEELFGLILRDEKDKVLNYLKEKIESVRSAPLKDLAITKTLSRNLDGYQKQKQDYLKSIEESPWLRVGAGDAVSILPALNFPYKVAVYQDISQLPRAPEVDYNTIIEKQVKAKAEEVLSLVGLSFAEVSGARRLF